MRFTVRFLRRRGGLLERREVDNQEPRVGDLRIEQVRDEAFRRYVHTAFLWDVGSVVPEHRPTLYDVRICGMSPQAFSLTGFERVDGVEYAQSWLVSQ
jgi:hypothetical protein